MICCDRLAPTSSPARTPFAAQVFHGMDAFQQLSREEMSRLLDVAVRKSFKASLPVIKAGRNSSAAGSMALFLVVSGVGKAWRYDADGNEDVLGYFATGDSFGAAAILDPDAPRRVNVTALTTMSCLLIDTPSLDEIELLERVKHGLARELSHRRWVLENRGNVLMKDLLVHSFLGRGTFGRVSLVEHSQSSRKYALKVQKKQLLLSSGQVGHIVSECKLLETCNHTFVLRLVAAYQDPLQLYLILELSLGGELFDLLRKQQTFPANQVRFYTACIVCAVDYFNSLQIMYRDLKLENLLLDEQGYIKVIDLGFAKVVESHSHTFCGTPDYMAPELIRCRPHSMPCDWWSIGILIYEMLVGQVPFFSETGDTTEIFKAILTYVSADAPTLAWSWFFPADAKDLIMKLLVSDPETRMKPKEMMRHAFLETIDTIQLETRTLEAPYVPTIASDTDTNNFEASDSEETDSEDEAEPPPELDEQLRNSTVFANFTPLSSRWAPGAEQVDSADADNDDDDGHRHGSITFVSSGT